MPTNQAVRLPAKGAALEIAEVPFPQAGGKQIVVKAQAIAVNPVDWIVQLVGGLIFPWLKYPLVLGWDVAGEVVAVGEEVTRFRVGDRVVGLAVGQDKAVNDSAEDAFQNYVLLREHMAAPLPPALMYEDAAVLPLAVSTAASGLFQTDYLALDHPNGSAQGTGKTLLVWGGSTSVGSNAIQLAVAAGYEVFTTASPRNHDYVRELGAVQAFDYRAPSVVSDIVRALQGRTLAGALAIGAGAAAPCIDVVGACPGGKFVSIASTPVSFDDAPARGGKRRWLAGKLIRLVAGNVGVMIRARRRGVRVKFVNGVTLLHNEVGPMIFVDFLPRALASGDYRAAPPPLVVGKGLSSVAHAFEIQKKGVSAQKVVVTL